MPSKDHPYKPGDVVVRPKAPPPPPKPPDRRVIVEDDSYARKERELRRLTNPSLFDRILARLKF